MIRHISYLLLSLLTGAVAFAESDQLITVKIRAEVAGTRGVSSGSGSFTVPSGEYGRTSLAFYNYGESYRMVASGSRVGPVLYLTDRYGNQQHTGDLTMTVELCLQPQVTTDEQIRLVGAMQSMIRSGDEKPPVYRYHEERFEFVMPNGGREEIIQLKGAAGADIMLAVSASSGLPLADEPKTTNNIDLQTSYYLLNIDKDRFEIENCRCLLGFAGDDDLSRGTCRQRKMFYLDSGDSLLLLTVFEIRNVRWKDDDRFSFDLDIARYYALNPSDADTLTSPSGAFINLGENGLASERMTIREFHREITTRNGEKIEVEIPSGDDNPLPFDFLERIVLTSRVSSTTN